MKTLIVSDVDTKQEYDRVMLSPDGKLTFDTGAARPMFDNLIKSGMSESEAFEMRTDWSNGYVQSKLA